MSGKSKHRQGRATDNPCIGLCRFGGDGACLGCHRTKAEVKGWKRLSDAAKAAINDRIAKGSRLAVQVEPAEGKAPRKRLRKLDRKIGKLESKLAALRAERDRVAGAGPAG
ncbi:DUF1289 domain-containing protein [Azospirillum sp. A1-3]|uniref:DUF1289 domain-containing protein n=1 Tax=Azospirillum sp. A1-3 TaxID=185874 RepID=UPI0020776E74|nr:DUF1289 domain-containing protein [Azospirillum sp. A1-3]MCM8737768.1 DUF1289 domain-containing protein [Azospirillum sp. A1-3]